MAALIDRVGRWYAMLAQIGNSLQSPFLLLVRLYWGWQFALTGWGKFHRLPQVVEFFTSLGIPAPALNAYFISGLELVGGVLLALGLGSRLLAALFIGDMVVAYITADREALLSIFSDPGKFYNAAPFTFLFAALIIFVFGPGRYALDTLVGRKWGTRAQ